MNLLLCHLVLLVCGSYAQSNVGDLDDIIKNVFTTASPTVPHVEPHGGGGDSEGGCDCVPYYQCNNNTLITDGVGLIDIRLKGQCESYLETCCSISDKTIDPITPTPPPDKPKGCGVHNENGIGFRITGNEKNEAQFGEFPWMVAVLREEIVEGNAEKLNVYQCGGSLIHPKVVLTAAHCVVGTKDRSKFKVRAGEWDTQTKNEIYNHEDRMVVNIIHHPDYYGGALFNDIALLFLETPFPIQDNIDVACLPPQDAVIDMARCYASGWGKDVFGKEGKYQVILKKIDLPIVNRHKCEEALRTTRLGKHFELHSSFVCAGGEIGKDTCKGDGGSPLVCPVPGRRGILQQAGIVAWGIGCGENGVPGVYANVAKFRDWIDEKLAYENLDITTYKY